MGVAKNVGTVLQTRTEKKIAEPKRCLPTSAMATQASCPKRTRFGTYSAMLRTRIQGICVYRLVSPKYEELVFTTSPGGVRDIVLRI